MNITGVWKYEDKIWNMKDGYIQDQNSSSVIALMDDVKASGTRVILTTKTNTSDSATWIRGSVYNQWFHLKPKGLDMFLTAESNNLTTVTGNDYALDLVLRNYRIERLASILLNISSSFTKLGELVV